MAYKRCATSVASANICTTRQTLRNGKTQDDSFAYNSKSELTSATLRNENFAYAFDEIGNHGNATEAGTPALWFVFWDPTQATATRPLTIQKNGTWFVYGQDLLQLLEKWLKMSNA
ncbi:MAG: hypothetical protein K6B46_02995 [Opitutales bacterium]|nr:hypothetical protein [Opitutales bacterium]